LLSREVRIDDGSEADASHRSAAERVIAAMRERADGTLPLSAMAEIAHLNPYYFARVFRRITGVTPGEFSTALRLERSRSCS
jgi:AraC family transcriptional regulator